MKTKKEIKEIEKLVSDCITALETDINNTEDILELEYRIPQILDIIDIYVSLQQQKYYSLNCIKLLELFSNMQKQITGHNSDIIEVIRDYKKGMMKAV